MHVYLNVARLGMTIFYHGISTRPSAVVLVGLVALHVSLRPRPTCLQSRVIPAMLLGIPHTSISYSARCMQL
jgi:hypothetical protein